MIADVDSAASTATAGALDQDSPFDFMQEQSSSSAPSRPAKTFPILRADYSFDAQSLANPSSDRDPGRICLSFSEADIVYIHYSHETGWADVTLLHNSQRGWVPINYFSPITDSRVIPLLAAAASFLNEPKSYRIKTPYPTAAPVYAISQAAISEIVAGVRELLKESGTLNWESAKIQHSQSIRRHRKALLTELAFVVSVAKQNKKSTDNAVVEKLIRGVYRIVNKALVLLDVLIEEENEARKSAIDKEPIELHRNPVEEFSPKRANSLMGRIEDTSAALCNVLANFCDRLPELSLSESAHVDILNETRCCMLACREFLVSVDELGDVLAGCEHHLDQVEDLVYYTMCELVSAAREAVRSIDDRDPNSSVLCARLASVTRKCSEQTVQCKSWCYSLLSVSVTQPSLYEQTDIENRAKTPKPAFEHPSSSHAQFEDAMPSPIGDMPASPRQSIIFASQQWSDESLQKRDIVSTLTPIAAEVPASPISPQFLENSDRSDDDDDDVITIPPKQPENKKPRELSVDINPEHIAPVPITVDESTRQLMDIHEHLYVHNGKVKGGTTEALIAWLTSSLADSFQQTAFLFTLHLFTTPAEVARLLVAEIDADIDTLALDLAVLWLESWWRPADKEAMPIFETLMGRGLPIDRAIRQRKACGTGQLLPLKLAAHKPCQNQNSASIRRRHSSISTVLLSPTNVLRKNSRRVSQDEIRLLAASTWGNAFKFGQASKATSKLLDYDPAEIAAQLTLMSAEIFNLLEPDELLDKRFSSKKRALGLAPHVTQLTQLTNHLTAFVGDTILGGDSVNAKTRKNILHLWLQVAEACYEQGNLNTMICIISTLQSSTIRRLRKVWDMLSAKSVAVMDQLSPLASPSRNFAEYRQELRARVGTSCIPYLGLYLSDLTFIEDGNPRTCTYKGTTVINFDRYVRMTRVISDLQTFQEEPPQLYANYSLQTWLREEMAKSHSALSRDGDDQWRRSCTIEPEN